MALNITIRSEKRVLTTLTVDPFSDLIRISCFCLFFCFLPLFRSIFLIRDLPIHLALVGLSLGLDSHACFLSAGVTGISQHTHSTFFSCSYQDYCIFF